MAYIDLSEIDSIFHKGYFCSQKRFSVVRFNRSDYLGDPSRNLAECVRELVESQTGLRTCGPVRMLTHLRYFGFTFNPITMYYCFAEDGEHLDAIVAEVTNTPWHERHAYVIPCDTVMDKTIQHQCSKQFHVSPFMEMDQWYRWHLSIPGESIDLQIENHDHNGSLFHAHLQLRRRDFTRGNLARLICFTPMVTAKVVFAIYWQALRLWLKKVPYVPHP